MTRPPGPGATPPRAGDRRLRRAGDDEGGAGLRPARRAHRRLRQRRHAVVREADADRARVHPARLAEMAAADPSLRDRQPWKAAHEQGLRAGSARSITKHYHGDDSDMKVLMGGILQAFAGHDRRRVRRRRATPSSTARSTRRSAARSSDCGYLADGRAAALPRGQRVHELHRLGRRPRLHAPGHRATSTASRPSGSSAARTRCATRRTTTAAPSSTRPRWTSSTTGRPSRCGSGAGSAGRPILAGGNSNGDIPMLQYAGGTGGRRCACSSSTTTRSASSTTPPAPRRRSSRPRRQGWTVVSMKDDWARVFADARDAGMVRRRRPAPGSVAPPRASKRRRRSHPAARARSRSTTASAGCCGRSWGRPGAPPRRASIRSGGG